MTVTISEIKKSARWSLKGKWGLGVLLTFLLFLLNSVIPMIVETIINGGTPTWNSTEPPSAWTSLASFIIALILIPVNISACWFYLSIARFESPKISQVFSIFSNGKTYFKLIGLSIVTGILVFLWTLLLVIPGIIKSFSYSQAYYLLKDHPEYTILEAITESRKRMDGYKWKYFLLNLSFIGWAILCLLTFGIGFLWLAPYISTSLGAFYNELISSKDEPIVD